MTKSYRWIARSPANRHVIFLGAGASVSSGYPLANDLTLMMCDAPTFHQKLLEALLTEGHRTKELERNNSYANFVANNQAAALLRSTEFSTMDELSKHVVGGKHAHSVRELKKLMRFMLALHNPNATHWSLSDYRYLIQKLFAEGSLLRKDVTIISYNYDPYFEFRLNEVHLARQETSGRSNEALKNSAQAIYSGFFKPEDLDWLKEDGFCHLKLHGTCAFPTGRRVGTIKLPLPPDSVQEFQAGYLFERSFQTIMRLQALMDPPFAIQDPPVLLPWEIMHEKDVRLLKEDEFESTVGKEWQHKDLYPLFKGIWERARFKVEKADKISFVGLSLGQYLEPGLRYLFRGKSNPIQLVIANPSNERFQAREGSPHPNSPAGRALEMLLVKCEVDAQIHASYSEYTDGFDQAAVDGPKWGEPREPSVTCHNSFREFIDAEL